MSAASCGDPGGDRPLGLEGRQQRPDLGEVHPVVAGVRTGRRREGHRRAEVLRHLLGDLADLDDILVAADVESLVVDRLAWSVECDGERAGDVLDVDQRPPRAAVGLQPHLAARERRPGEVVDDNVGPQPGRGPVSGRVTQVGRAEGVVGEGRQAGLRPHLALAVGRHRVERGLLVHRGVARRSVEGAGGREEVPLDARGLGHPPEVDRAVGVHRVGRARVEVTDRVVGDRGQVHDRVVPPQVVGPHVPDVEPAPRNRRRGRPEVTPVVPAGVQALDLVTGRLEVGDEDRAHIPTVTTHAYAHAISPLCLQPWFQPTVRRLAVFRKTRTRQGCAS